ncbi:MAG: DNA-3-methyladenine glycosylase family protein [Candidatus Cybelea sp.]
MPVVCDLPLVGAGGEPISFSRTIHSHGVARLPPATVQESPLRYLRRFRIGKRVVELTFEERHGRLLVQSPSRLARGGVERVQALVAKMFRFHDNLAPFYAKIAGDEMLGWAGSGAGRILASPTVFEDVIKTICTTNCAWSATVRMTTALVELGGGAFPEPELLAATPESWYRDVARMGYRGPYVRSIAKDVVAGKLDLESLTEPARYSDEEAEEMLLTLPGIGPYGAAHVMQLLGRHRLLVLDSWTRPSYRRLTGKKRAADSTIRRAFARYGEYAGLAFWLFLTRYWVEAP